MKDTAVVSLVVCSVLLGLSAKTVISLPLRDRSCGGDYNLFFDHGTEHCEECREICEHADIKGTQEQCQQSCPKYLFVLKCVENKEEYYDEMVDACSACGPICDNHMHTRTSTLCQEKCSAYMAKLTPEQVPSLHKQNSLKAVGHDANDEVDSPSDNLSMHPGWIATIAVGSFAILGSVLVVVALYKICRSPYMPANRTEGPRNGRQPIPETTGGTEAALTANVALLSHQPSNGHTTGFSDLGNDGSREDSIGGRRLCVV